MGLLILIAWIGGILLTLKLASERGESFIWKILWFIGACLFGPFTAFFVWIMSGTVCGHCGNKVDSKIHVCPHCHVTFVRGN